MICCAAVAFVADAVVADAVVADAVVADAASVGSVASSIRHDTSSA